MNHSTLLKCTASAMVIAIAGGGAAFAQATSTPPSSSDRSSADDQNVGEIVVTGSRVATGADAPTPVTVVSPEAINQVALPNIADALIQLPALRSSVSSSKGGQGAQVGAQLNLRGLGAFRTLVLVDGKRFVATPAFATGQGQAVNIDALPQGLIKRVETVTGGASAAYGSDAVAGVVNFVLDKTFEGLKGDASYGQTSRNDGQRYSADISAGGAFAEGRGHIIMDAEYAKDDGIDNDVIGGHPARPFQNAANTIGRENVNGTLQIVHNARLTQVPLNGLIVGCKTNAGVQQFLTCPVYGTGTGVTTIGTSFNDTGTATQPYNFGTRNTTSSVFANGGDGYQPGGQSVLDTPSTRSSIYTRVGYDITPKLNIYFDALSAKTLSLSEAGSGTPGLVNSASLGIPISVNYAYIPADLKAAMLANNIASINIQKTFNFNVQQTFENRTNRFVTGANYQLNDNWSGDIYYTYGETRDSLKLGNFTNTIALQNALSAVKDPITGAITCSQGGSDCVPYNIFGQAPLTTAQSNYINPIDYYFTNNSQQVVEATIKGSPLTLPAGKVDIALGAGYRKEKLAESTDTLGLASKTNPYNGNPGALIYINSPAIMGALDLGEVFGEAQVPVFRDQFLAKSLELNLAARYTNYSSSGGVATWKAGAVWVPVDGVRFRVAESRDVRAANLVELFSPNSSGFASVRDPQKGGNSVSIIPITSGNPNLTPEKANTSTIGVVLNPTFWPSLYASIDFFNIKIADEISTVNSQLTLNLCTLSPTTYADFCSRITRNSNGDITTIRTPYSNLASGKNQGIDVELGYTHGVDRFGLKGNAALRLFGTYVFENSTTTPGTPPVTTDVAPQSGRLVALATADYSSGPWTFGLQEHYVSGGRFTVLDPRYVGDTASSQLWTDIVVKRRMGSWEAYGSIQNLFDKDPPNYPFTAPSSGLGSSTLFDVQGRRFMIGAKFKL